ncbi:BLUF domain-containing protein [Qipengyuania sp. JC766]|uniref:BLUF domain-containing protein n=1 Tax=Qipengyuania sp. JC766 TaxID=3232139 RepID=UPI00345A1163
MIRIAYISTAEALEEANVDAILQSAMRRNAHVGITGFLLYNGRNFLQVLEGASEDLNALMRRIGSDPRHSGIVKIDDARVEDRTFPDWAMKRISLNHDRDRRREEIAGLLPERFDGHLRQSVLNFAVLN